MGWTASASGKRSSEAEAVIKNRARYMEAGLTDFATKPIDWDKLRSLIEAVVERRRVDATAAFEGHPHAIATMLCTRTLGKLLDGLGEAVLDRFLNDLPAELRRQSGRAIDAARLGCPENMRENAHSLSGMAGNFGLLSIRDAARSVEHAPAGRVDAADLDRLSQAVEDGIAARCSWRRSFDVRQPAKGDLP
jgi:HPt (histidine-containing phosphotransfer) domain-containing protein